MNTSVECHFGGFVAVHSAARPPAGLGPRLGRAALRGERPRDVAGRPFQSVTCAGGAVHQLRALLGGKGYVTEKKIIINCCWGCHVVYGQPRSLGLQAVAP